MSWRVANTCAERKFGSATRKQIIMFLADKASDDGSGIWCSKPRRLIEMSSFRSSSLIWVFTLCLEMVRSEVAAQI